MASGSSTNDSVLASTVELAAEAVGEAVELQAVVAGEVFFHPGEGLVSLGVVAERLGLLVERLRLAEPVRDVGQVAEGAGVVAFEDVGVEVVGLAAADGGDEVAEVALARPPLGVCRAWATGSPSEPLAPLRKNRRPPLAGATTPSSKWAKLPTFSPW